MIFKKLDKDNIDTPIQSTTPKVNESITIRLTDKDVGFWMSFNNTDNGATMTFERYPLDNTPKEESTIDLSLEEYNDFIKELNSIIEKWSSLLISPIKYKKASPTLIWKMEINTNQNQFNYEGIGEVPENWNRFIDLLSKYEIVFKKTIELQPKPKIEPTTTVIISADVEITRALPIINITTPIPGPRSLPRIAPRKKPAVTKKDWTTVPMPPKNENIKLARKLTNEDIEVLKRGHIPQEMEDKWFWYVEDDILYIHRSWTGFCIYEVSLNTNGILDVKVNRDESQYRCNDAMIDSQNLNALLNFWTKNKES